ncbi:MAG: NAD(P)-binding domain-containing protein [Bacteroidetes bacterium]|nr:NAD(P)-binding domain-containing protein [Bacteroidota bacterium]
MNITIIGTGNVGGALAAAFKKAGHTVILGVRNPVGPFKGKELADRLSLPVHGISEAISKSEVIVLATPAPIAAEVAKSLGDVHDKVIIDTMNAVFTKPEGYNNTAEAILANCNCTDVVKCFNTTGFENMLNPIYNGEGIDMFVAGSSEKGKKIAMQLSKDIGFSHCWDFGGNDKFTLIEQMAGCWINLAIIQKHGRGMAFKVVKRG